MKQYSSKDSKAPIKGDVSKAIITFIKPPPETPLLPTEANPTEAKPFKK